MASTNDWAAPVMEPGEIVELAKRMLPDIRLTEEDLKSPRSSHILYLYEQVLTDLRVNLDSVRVSHWQALPLEYSEGFEEALPLVRFGKFLEKFMSKIGVPDFKFRDIINPQPKRTRRFLSALFNFWNFAESQSEQYQEIVKKASDAKEEHLRLQSIMEQAKKQINEIKKKTTEEEPAYLMLQEEIDQKRLALDQLSGEIKVLKETFSNIKLGSSEMASSNADQVLKVQKAKQENNILVSQIVRSPERFREDVAHERQRLESLLESKHQQQLRLQELVQHTEQLKKVQATLCIFNEIMDCIAKELNTERDLDMKLKEVRSINQRFQRELADMQTQKLDLQEQLSSKKERVAAFDLQHAAKINALQQRLRAALSDADIVEQFQRERDIVLTDLHRSREQVLQDMEAVNKNADVADADIQDLLCKLLSAVDEFNQKKIAELLELEDRMIKSKNRAEERLKKLETLDIDSADFVKILQTL